MSVRSYTLTRSAESDLDEMHRSSLALYGRIQTNRFMIRLKKAAEFAASHMDKIPTRVHRTGESGLCLYPVNNFFIAYYPVSARHIVIVSIFRQSRDIAALIMAEAEKYRQEFDDIAAKIRQGDLVICGESKGRRARRKKKPANDK